MIVETPNERRSRIARAKQEDQFQWHQWWAWYPVRVLSGQLALWRTLERRRSWQGCHLEWDGMPPWIYRLQGSEEDAAS